MILFGGPLTWYQYRCHTLWTLCDLRDAALRSWDVDEFARVSARIAQVKALTYGEVLPD